MKRVSTQQARHFRIGVISASLTTSVSDLMEQYTSLYRAFQIERPGDRAIHVEARPAPFSPWHRKRYVVRVNGRTQFEPARRDEVLPYVEWAINWEVPRVMPEYLQLHASSMEVDGCGVVFPGESGSGKSTLTAGLLARGWRYLCDEFALIHADTLELHPYPRAICVKRPSYPVIESLGLKIHGNRHYLKGAKGYVGFIAPLEVRSDAVGVACPIRYVILPKYTQGAEPALVPISRAEAAFALHGVCFNLLKCQAVGLDVLAEMVRGASCYRLISGEIQKTCDVVEQLVQGGYQRCVKIA
jgi:HprK-related kinase A